MRDHQAPKPGQTHLDQSSIVLVLIHLIFGRPFFSIAGALAKSATFAREETRENLRRTQKCSLELRSKLLGFSSCDGDRLV